MAIAVSLALRRQQEECALVACRQEQEAAAAAALQLERVAEERFWRFMDAAGRGDVLLMSELHDEDPALVARTNRRGETALHVAVAAVDTEAAARWLLQHAPQLATARDSRGATPLHAAAKAANVAAVHVLLAHAPQTALAQDAEGRTPLLTAASEFVFTGNGRLVEVQCLLREAAPAADGVADHRGRTPHCY